MAQAARDFDFRPAIERAVASFQKAANVKDAATIAKLYADDATLLPPGSPPIKGRAGIQAFWQSLFDAGASDAKVRIVEVRSCGDLAYEIGAFEAKLPTPQGGVAPAEGKYVVVWKQQADGGIKMIADIFNSNS
jgi:uncharacterized protein (TIGR02246 family)